MKKITKNYFSLTQFKLGKAIIFLCLAFLSLNVLNSYAAPWSEFGVEPVYDEPGYYPPASPITPTFKIIPRTQESQANIFLTDHGDKGVKTYFPEGVNVRGLSERVETIRYAVVGRDSRTGQPFGPIQRGGYTGVINSFQRETYNTFSAFINKFGETRMIVFEIGDNYLKILKTVSCFYNYFENLGKPGYWPSKKSNCTPEFSNARYDEEPVSFWDPVTQQNTNGIRLMNIYIQFRRIWNTDSWGYPALTGTYALYESDFTHIFDLRITDHILIKGNIYQESNGVTANQQDNKNIKSAAFLGGKVYGGKYSMAIGKKTVVTNSPYSIIVSSVNSRINNSDASAIIAGGQAEGGFLYNGRDEDSAIAAGQGGNLIENSSYSIVVSGYDSHITGSVNAAIIGGSNLTYADGNVLYPSADPRTHKPDYSYDNRNLVSNSQNSVISGGRNNKIYNSHNSITIGGDSLTINPQVGNNNSNAIAGGKDNSITEASYRSFIAAGNNNLIKKCRNCAIIAGRGNTIATYDSSSNSSAVILVGENNLIRTFLGESASQSVIIGGKDNNIYASLGSLIIGGSDNYIFKSDYVTIAGAHGIRKPHAHGFYTGIYNSYVRDEHIAGEGGEAFVVGNGIRHGAGSNAFVITNDGVATASSYTLLSDRRMKKNIIPIDYGIAELMQLNPVAYQLKVQKDDEKQKLGLIAQEVKKIIPEVVNGKDGEDSYLSLNYDNLVSLLVKAIQQNQKQIETHLTEINQLEDEFKNLIKFLEN